MWLAACILIGIPQFVQMLGFTGPMNCGKAFLALCIVAVLGQGSTNLCQVMLPNYLTKPPSDEAEASKPLLAEGYCQIGLLRTDRVRLWTAAGIGYSTAAEMGRQQIHQGPLLRAPGGYEPKCRAGIDFKLAVLWSPPSKPVIEQRWG